MVAWRGSPTSLCAESPPPGERDGAGLASDPRYVSAASVLAAVASWPDLPMTLDSNAGSKLALVVFFVAQDLFAQSIALTGLKG